MPEEAGHLAVGAGGVGEGGGPRLRVGKGTEWAGVA
jgi:hypothetical protein